MDAKIDALIQNWQRKNITGFYLPDQEKALNKILALIPQACSIGFSGSMTLEQLGLLEHLEARGNKVFNASRPNLAQEEKMDARRKSLQADYYLASPNAISEKGEMVFFSAYHNRICGVSAAKNVIIVSGINKIAPNLEEALKRAREYATPLNCKRLNWNTPCVQDGICRESICLFPEYKRMCCQILIVEAEIDPQRIKVVLVGENLGF